MSRGPPAARRPRHGAADRCTASCCSPPSPRRRSPPSSVLPLPPCRRELGDDPEVDCSCGSASLEASRRCSCASSAATPAPPPEAGLLAGAAGLAPPFCPDGRRGEDSDERRPASPHSTAAPAPLRPAAARSSSAPATPTSSRPCPRHFVPSAPLPAGVRALLRASAPGLV
nr:predicted GPI-anchored protein 58 [Aegilops tauschii subsp. strangulata]